MDAELNKLYSELRKSKLELQKKMKHNQSSAIQPLIQEELNDIETAINKIHLGNYGICELSGELIPFEVLEVIPTIKSLNDITVLNQFFRKPI